MRSHHLCGAIASGDERAFAEFYELWFERVHATVRAVTGRDETFCLDVVQECMMRVIKSIPRCSSEAALGAWMSRTALRISVDHLRRDSRRRERERMVAGSQPRESADIAAVFETDEQLRWLREQLAELSPADRSLVLQRFEQGKTLDQIGAAVGISGDAAHGRLWRLTRRLRRAAQELFDA